MSAKAQKCQSVRSQEFLLENKSGEVIASLTDSGLGTPILNLSGLVRGSSATIGVSPDGTAFLEMKSSDSTIKLLLQAESTGGLSIALSKNSNEIPFIFRCHNDGAMSLEISGELAVLPRGNTD